MRSHVVLAVLSSLFPNLTYPVDMVLPLNVIDAYYVHQDEAHILQP